MRHRAPLLPNHPWTTVATRRDSEILGTFYVHRGKENRIWCIETDEGFGLDDLFAELATLEQKACGQVIHGIVRGEAT
jgi:hypothetical protein